MLAESITIPFATRTAHADVDELLGDVAALYAHFSTLGEFLDVLYVRAADVG